MRGVAERADAGPWESIWVYDHFHTVPSPTDEATYEAWTLMAALSVATTRVRLGQMCTCIGYRNPAYLAKVAATIDVISGGRLEMGIGAGWYEHEWRAHGYGFPSDGERLAMLDEGVQIMRTLWADGQASFAGAQYQVDGAICQPRPLQSGGIPLWVAGGGERKTLRIAANYASYTNFDGSLDGFRHKSEVLAEHCRDVGRDFDEITRSSNYFVILGATDADVRAKLDWVREHYAQIVPAKADGTRRQFASGPLVGTPEHVVEALRALDALGMSYAICVFIDAAYDSSSIELFEREVIPALGS